MHYLIYTCHVKLADNWCSILSQKLQKVLEDRDELEASKTILGRMLTCLIDEGVLDANATNECVLAPPHACC